jgi:hypothetical protein
MMLKRFLVAAVFLIAACQSTMPPRSQSEETPTAAPLITDEAEVTETVAAPSWLETEMNGVSLGMWRPDGWEADQSQGLVVAEHTVTAWATVEGGILIYCFVPLVDQFDVEPNAAANFALAVLDKVVKMPSHTGRDVAVSQPVGFEWDNHPAAYYLLTTGDGVRALVLAIALSDEQKVVVCNLSVPGGQADRIREMTPQVLDGLTVDGEALDGATLEALPDPLPFPRYSLASNYANQPVASNSPTNPP